MCQPTLEPIAPQSRAGKVSAPTAGRTSCSNFAAVLSSKLPLFVGLSCTPYVYYKEKATGPNAGEFLQPVYPLPQLLSPKPVLNIVSAIGQCAGQPNPWQVGWLTETIIKAPKP